MLVLLPNHTLTARSVGWSITLLVYSLTLQLALPRQAQSKLYGHALQLVLAIESQSLYCLLYCLYCTTCSDRYRHTWKQCHLACVHAHAAMTLHIKSRSKRIYRKTYRPRAKSESLKVGTHVSTNQSVLIVPIPALQESRLETVNLDPSARDSTVNTHSVIVIGH